MSKPPSDAKRLTGQGHRLLNDMRAAHGYPLDGFTGSSLADVVPLAPAPRPQPDPNARACRRPKCERKLVREEFTRTRPGQPGEKVVRWRCTRIGWGDNIAPCGWYEDESDTEDLLAERMQRMDEKAAQRREAGARGGQTNRARRAARVAAEDLRIPPTPDELPGELIAPPPVPEEAATDVADVEELLQAPPPPPATPPSSADALPDVPAPTITEEATPMPARRKTAKPDPTAPASYTPEQRRRVAELVLDEGYTHEAAALEVGMLRTSAGWYVRAEKERRAKAAVVADRPQEPPVGLAMEGPAHEGIDPQEREATADVQTREVPDGQQVFTASCSGDGCFRVLAAVGETHADVLRRFRWKLRATKNERGSYLCPDCPDDVSASEAPKDQGDGAMVFGMDEPVETEAAGQQTVHMRPAPVDLPLEKDRDLTSSELEAFLMHSGTTGWKERQERLVEQLSEIEARRQSIEGVTLRPASPLYSEEGVREDPPLFSPLFHGEDVEEIHRATACEMEYPDDGLSFPERLNRAAGDLHILARSMDQRAAAFRAAIAAMAGIA